MVVISHFKLYSALFPLKWLICIPNMSAVRGNAVFETLHDFYRTAIFVNVLFYFGFWSLAFGSSICHAEFSSASHREPLLVLLRGQILKRVQDDV